MSENDCVCMKLVMAFLKVLNLIINHAMFWSTFGKQKHVICQLLHFSISSFNIEGQGSFLLEFFKKFWKSQPWTRTLTLSAWLEEKQTCLPQTIYSVNNHNLSLLSWKLITPNTLLHIPWLPSTFTTDFTHKCSLLIW